MAKIDTVGKDPSVQIITAHIWQRQLQSSVRLAILVICVLILIYFVAIIVGLDKVHHVLLGVDQQRVIYEKLSQRVENVLDLKPSDK